MGGSPGSWTAIRPPVSSKPMYQENSFVSFRVLKASSEREEEMVTFGEIVGPSDVETRRVHAADLGGCLVEQFELPSVSLSVILRSSTQPTNLG